MADFIQIGGQRIDGDAVDLAELLIELDQHEIRRDTLRRRWSQIVTDLHTNWGHVHYVRAGKGRLASFKLKEALVKLERLGALERRDGHVSVQDPRKLRTVVAAWDADNSDGKEGP